jgi:hypothetical protein
MYFMVIWSILRSFGIFCSHLVYFVVIRNIFTDSVYCIKTNLATLMPAPPTINCSVSGFEQQLQKKLAKESNPMIGHQINQN